MFAVSVTSTLDLSSVGYGEWEKKLLLFFVCFCFFFLATSKPHYCHMGLWLLDLFSLLNAIVFTISPCDNIAAHNEKTPHRHNENIAN